MPVITIGNNTGDDYSGATSSKIVSDQATTNYSSDTGLGTLRDPGAPTYAHSLFAFPIPSDLVGATVNSVKLSLYQTAGYTEGTMDLNVYKILPAMVMSEVTYNIYSTGNNWNTAGAQGSGTDRAATASSSLTGINGGASGVWLEFPTSSTFEADVEGAADDTLTLLVQAVSGQYSVNFSAAIAGVTDGQRAYLEIDYTAGGGSTVGAARYALSQMM